MLPLLLVMLQAAGAKPQAELQGTLLLLIGGVAAAAFFLWLIMSRFSRPP